MSALWRSGRIMRSRRGQSFAEYIIVTSVLLLALTSGSPSPVTKLYNALRANYKGFAFAVTRPVIVPSDPVGEIQAKANELAGKASGCVGGSVSAATDCVTNLAQWAGDAGIIPTKEEVKDELTNAILGSIDLGPFQPIIDWMSGN